MSAREVVAEGAKMEAIKEEKLEGGKVEEKAVDALLAVGMDAAATAVAAVATVAGEVRAVKAVVTAAIMPRRDVRLERPAAGGFGQALAMWPLSLQL